MTGLLPSSLRTTARAGWVFWAALSSAMALQAAPQDSGSVSNPPPALSDRRVQYEMKVELDAEAKTLRGTEVVTWHNSSSQSVDNFCFHLYLNAFRNNRSTLMRENRFRNLWGEGSEISEENWGYAEVASLQVVSGTPEDRRRVEALQFIYPDDGNEEDRTVLEARLDRPLGPGGTIRFKVDFESRLPRGARRTGWVEDYIFAAQWFPKLGVFQEEGWNCHQYHLSTEYFADFGVYDVSLTVPEEFVVGATGRRLSRIDNNDGTKTVRYYQEDVHDFAWTASPRFLERTRVFSHPGLKDVEVTLLLLPEHASQEARHFQAVENALRSYGTWFGSYPYDTLTVVDPAYNSRTGGMEYPTLVTAGTRFWAPATVLTPESVIVHEVGHQWWYGMVANNEFEEAWLDEGLNSWSDSRAQKFSYEPSRFMVRLFGGIPLVFDSVRIPFETSSLPRLRRFGRLDVMTRPGWKYSGRDSYVTNSYAKPEMILWTLERWLGENLMLRVMRSFFERYRFRHPTVEDFISTAVEVSGKDLRWFFDETLFGSDLFDYSVSRATSVKIPERQGRFDRHGSGEEGEDPVRNYLTEVDIRRLEGGRFPVEILLVFEDGEELRTAWAGRDRWHRVSVERPVRLEYAEVDPDRKLLLDIDPLNNSRYRETDGISLAAWKWSSKWLFWLQNLLEVFAFTF